MTFFTRPGGGRRKGAFAAALLATTVLAGGGFAWAESDNSNPQTAPATAPLGLAPVVNQAGFYSAFGVKEGDKMYLAPANRVNIW